MPQRRPWSFLQKWGPLCILILAIHPVWVYLALRFTDGSDEPWGIVALITAVAITVLGKTSAPRELFTASSVLLVYCVSHVAAPPLIRAAVGLCAMGALLCRMRPNGRIELSVIGLLMLALPVIASLQFFLGLPLRLLSAHISALFLAPAGFDIFVDGTFLRWGGHVVCVDAPCSGIRALWGSLFIVFACCAAFRASNSATAWTAILAVAVAVGANGLRAASLFYLETGIVQAPAWMHDAVGVTIFAAVAGALAWVCAGHSPEPELPESSQPKPVDASFRTQHVVYLLSCVIAAWAPFLAHGMGETARSANEPVWPTEFEGRRLTRLPLAPAEDAFTHDFPGAMAKFTDGVRLILIREVSKETRKLHPAVDCFRAGGYDVHSRGVVTQADGAVWSQFTASKSGDRLNVRERITDLTGVVGDPDVSTWYWRALLGRARGPWRCITLVE